MAKKESIEKIKPCVIKESKFGVGGISDITKETIAKISTLVMAIKAHITNNNLEVLNSKYVRNATMLRKRPNRLEDM